MPESIIFHVDVNSAFLSWAAADLLLRRELDYDIRSVFGNAVQYVGYSIRNQLIEVQEQLFGYRE